jgi:hypothetical protein
MAWDTYISKTESGVHGQRRYACKVMKHLDREKNDNFHVNLIPNDQRERNFQELSLGPNVKEEEDAIDIEEIDPLTYKELKETLNDVHNRKYSEVDGLNLELFKYRGTLLELKLVHFLKICWKEWSTAIAKIIFKKGDRSDCSNWRHKPTGLGL